MSPEIGLVVFSLVNLIGLIAIAYFVIKFLRKKKTEMN